MDTPGLPAQGVEALAIQVSGSRVPISTAQTPTDRTPMARGVARNKRLSNVERQLYRRTQIRGYPGEYGGEEGGVMIGTAEALGSVVWMAVVVAGVWWAAAGAN